MLLLHLQKLLLSSADKVDIENGNRRSFCKETAAILCENKPDLIVGFITYNVFDIAIQNFTEIVDFHSADTISFFYSINGCTAYIIFLY